MATDSQIILLTGSHAEPLPPAVRSENESCQWRGIATRVGAAAAVLGYVGAAMSFSKAFSANPGINFAAGSAAGSIWPIAAILDLDEDNRPLPIDRKLFGFLTKFDVPIFLALNMAQWITPQTTVMRQLWFPLIFVHGGSVIAWELLQKWLEKKVNHGERRYLFEGDTVGSFIPFAIKGSLFLTAGVGAAIFGGIQKSPAGWRLGFMGIGYSVGIAPAQQLFSRLKRLMDSYARMPAGVRKVQGKPLLQIALAKLASISSTLGKMGVSAAGAVLVTLPVASKEINAVSAVCNFLVGFPMALVDVGQQHNFLYPEANDYEPLSEADEARNCFSRAWSCFTNRPLDYAGIAGTGALMTAMLVGNLIFPTENSILYASLLAGGSVVTFATGRIVEAIWPPVPDEEHAIRNNLVFRVTRNAHMYGAALIPLLGIYVSNKISLLEFDFLWALYGAAVGASLHEMLTSDPALTAYTSILYLLLYSVTATLFIEGQI